MKVLPFSAGQHLFPCAKMTWCNSISLNIVGNPLLSLRSWWVNLNFIEWSTTQWERRVSKGLPTMLREIEWHRVSLVDGNKCWPFPASRNCAAMVEWRHYVISRILFENRMLYFHVKFNSSWNLPHIVIVLQIQRNQLRVLESSFVHS